MKIRKWLAIGIAATFIIGSLAGNGYMNSVKHTPKVIDSVIVKRDSITTIKIYLYK